MGERLAIHDGHSVHRRLGLEIYPSTVEERQRYAAEFRTVIDSLAEKCGGYSGWWVVGGIAREVTIGNQDFTVKSPGGRWRDVDFLFDRKNRHALETLDYSGFLSLGGATLQSCVDISPDHAILRHGRVKVEVPPKVFETQFLSLGDVRFPSLSAQTLLHLYAVGDRPKGHMRTKDFLGALDLARYNRKHPQEGFSEKLYEGFHAFSDKKAEPGFMTSAREIATWYRTSRYNDVFPINRGVGRKIAFHVLELLQR